MKRLLQIILVAYFLTCLYVLVSYGMLWMIVQDMATTWLAAVSVMVMTFLFARRLKRYDIIDAAWGMSFIAITLTAAWLGRIDFGLLSPKTLVVGLVGIWGVRLTWHIAQRVRRTHEEDRRYVELRRHWNGNEAIQMFFRVYMVQALLALLVSIAVIHILLSKDVSWSIWTLAGASTWVVGFLCEAVADRQLATFLSKPTNRGQLMTSGLWRYARYPNYFGELTMWWGIAIMAFGTPHGWVGVGGALVITYLIVFVSGIPLKEKALRKRSSWQSYVKHTRLLAPLPKL